ncbi:hypothetical protein BC832DRAFT_590231 [Gaertneriomyces semiglobifer]|nr:hypothetical protein BC832DRAFT_590231 [Gaertneriomyces semiglobifer]
MKDVEKLSASMGTAFVVAIPPSRTIEGVQGSVAALLLTAAHNVRKNRVHEDYNPHQFYYLPEVEPDPKQFRPKRAGILSIRNVNGCTHEVNGDAALLAVLETPINDEALKDIEVGEDKTMYTTANNIPRHTILVPSISMFSSDETVSDRIAAIGKCDFNDLFPKQNPLNLQALRRYLYEGQRKIAALGETSSRITLQECKTNDGYAAAVSANIGMSGGPALDLNSIGIFNGLLVGGASESDKLHLIHVLFDTLDTDPLDNARLSGTLDQLRAYLKVHIPDVSDATDYDRRQQARILADRVYGFIKDEAYGQQTVAQLNHNLFLSVAGRSIAELYKKFIVQYVDTDMLTTEQKQSWEAYRKYLATVGI